MPHRFKPSLAAVVPSDWYVVEAVELFRPDPPAHVVVTGHFVDPRLNLHQYAEAHGRVLRDRLPEYRESDLRHASLFGGRDSLVRTFTWTREADGMSFEQVQAYFVDSGRAYAATATSAAASNSSIREELIAVLNGLEVSRPELAADSLVRHASRDPRGSAFDVLDRGAATVEIPGEADEESAASGWTELRKAWVAVAKEASS